MPTLWMSEWVNLAQQNENICYNSDMPVAYGWKAMPMIMIMKYKYAISQLVICFAYE